MRIRAEQGRYVPAPGTVPEPAFPVSKNGVEKWMKNDKKAAKSTPFLAKNATWKASNLGGKSIAEIGES